MENYFAEDRLLVGDAGRIQQVLLNLLSNARKYVPKNTSGKIKINSMITQNDGKLNLTISVIDNGPGISAEDQQKLFEPFCKLEANSDCNPNGIGLGLSICKLICESLGGNIMFNSDYGTEFTF